MTTLFYIGFFGWIVVIAATIFLNWYRIEKRGKKPHYFSSNWSRAVFGFACLGLMEQTFDPLGSLRSWIDAAPSIVYICSSFYLFFDPGLSLSRKKDIDYRGKSSGWMDPILTKGTWWILKGISLAVLIWSIITLWK